MFATPPDIDSTGSESVLGVGAVGFILLCTQTVHSMATGTARFKSEAKRS